MFQAERAVFVVEGRGSFIFRCSGKLALEYFNSTDQVPGKATQDRLTLLADLAF